MPGSLLLACLAAAVPAARASPLAERVSVGLPLEVDLVGLAWGLHPELLYRPLASDGALHLRAATGVMVGPELALVPVSAGVRGEMFPRRKINPGLGAGLQLQGFFPYGTDPRARLDVYLELTTTVALADGWAVSAQISPEVGMVGGFGFGMAARLGVQRDLPG